ncbi:MAG: hypothetical protein ACLFMO_04865 [Eubacteriales bacterium]
MNLSTTTICPICNNNNFTAKHEATYIYNYKFTTSGEIEEDFLPFLFDNREHLTSKQYIECDNCKSKYPCEFGPLNKGINMTILQTAIRSEHVDSPDFLG